jgi:hypothetical protein
MKQDKLIALLRANNADYAIWEFSEPWVSMHSVTEVSCYERPISWLEQHNMVREDPTSEPYNYVLESYTGGFIYFGVTLQQCLDFLPKYMNKPIQEIEYA